MSQMIHVAYDDRLLNWKLGKGHPTNPIRAKRATELLWNRLPGGVKVEKITRKVSNDDLERCHDPEYVAETLAGRNVEWSGVRRDLGVTARHMFAGTAQLVDQILAGTLHYGFSPQGAKHHAQFDYGSGFCVFNDFAYAALRLADEGYRVLYVDTDAHHGDGVENLTRDNPRVMTASVHDSTIFPGTGRAHLLDAHVLNYPLPAGSGDLPLVNSVLDLLARADAFDPHVVLFAIGGDGYRDDPLSTLDYTYAGYTAVASMVGSWSGLRGLPILMGGAGGYLPETHTPRVWATVVEGVYRASEEVIRANVGVHQSREVI